MDEFEHDSVIATVTRLRPDTIAPSREWMATTRARLLAETAATEVGVQRFDVVPLGEVGVAGGPSRSRPWAAWLAVAASAAVFAAGVAVVRLDGHSTRSPLSSAEVPDSVPSSSEVPAVVPATGLAAPGVASQPAMAALLALPACAGGAAELASWAAGRLSPQVFDRQNVEAKPFADVAVR
ncbi:MAG: hypothetical protein WCC60_02685, partial [Ilumatobacteraceae bacterium]